MMQLQKLGSRATTLLGGVVILLCALAMTRCSKEQALIGAWYVDVDHIVNQVMAAVKEPPHEINRGLVECGQRPISLERWRRRAGSAAREALTKHATDLINSRFEFRADGTLVITQNAQNDLSGGQLTMRPESIEEVWRWTLEDDRILFTPAETESEPREASQTAPHSWRLDGEQILIGAVGRTLCPVILVKL